MTAPLVVFRMNTLFEKDLGHTMDTVYFWFEMHEDLYRQAESAHPGIITNTMRTLWKDVYGTHMHVKVLMV